MHPFTEVLQLPCSCVCSLVSLTSRLHVCVHGFVPEPSGRGLKDRVSLPQVCVSQGQTFSRTTTLQLLIRKFYIKTLFKNCQVPVLSLDPVMCFVEFFSPPVQNVIQGRVFCG